MFGSWFGDFGAVKKAKAAAKKKALSKKVPRTPKPRARKYPRVTAMPEYGPAMPYGPTAYESEEEGGFFRPPTAPSSPMMPIYDPTTSPELYARLDELASRSGPARRGVSQAASSVTIGKPTANTQTVCGCKVVKMKNGRKALKCPGGPTGKGMFRFAKEAEIARAEKAATVCTHVPVFGVSRGPLTPEQKAQRAMKRAYTFETSTGKRITLKRKPSWKTLKKNVQLYYNMIGQRAKARGAKLRYAPSFADIGDMGWGW